MSKSIVYKNKRASSGFSLMLVLMILFSVSVGAALFVTRSNSIWYQKTAASGKKMLSLQSQSILESIKERLRNRIGFAFSCGLNTAGTGAACLAQGFEVGNSGGKFGTPINAQELVANLGDYDNQIEATCIDDQGEDFCRYDLLNEPQPPNTRLRNYPKRFRILVRSKDPITKAQTVVRAMVEVSPESLRDVAYLVTNESNFNNTVNFGNGHFGGRVGIMFSQDAISNAQFPPRINFGNTADLTFERTFFTNVSEDQFTYSFQNAPAPDFQAGVLSGASGVSDLLTNHFSEIVNSNQAGLFKTTPFSGAYLNYESISIEVGLPPNGTECHARMTYQPMLDDVDGCLAMDPDFDLVFCEWFAQFIPPVPGPEQIAFDGPVQNGSVFYADAVYHPPLYVKPLDPSRNEVDLCQESFSIISKGDVFLNASIKKRNGVAPTQGNVAIVSEQGVTGVFIPHNAKSLIPNSTLMDLATSGTPVPSDQVTFQVDATLLAISNQGSAPYLSSELLYGQDRQSIGKLKTTGGLIGAKWTPTRLIDQNTGQARSGFATVEMAFSEGMIAAPPPGLESAQTSTMGAAITSLDVDTRTIEDAIADLY